MYSYYYIDATEQSDPDADLHQASGSSSPILHTLPLSQPKRASTVRVKKPPSVRNERRTRRRIYDEEMGLREASASHGQYEQAAEDGREVPAGQGQDTQGVEDVREAPAGHGQDKQAAEDVREAPAGCGKDKLGVEDVREVPEGHGEDKQDHRGARQAQAGHGQSRLGPHPPPGFPRHVGARHNQPIVRL